MILILDASSQDFHIPGIYTPYPSVRTSITIDRLSYLFNLDLRRDLINEIDSVVIFNLDLNELSVLDINNWANACIPRRKYPYKLSKVDRRIKKLLQNLTIYNYKDLGLGSSDLIENKLIENKLFNIWSKPLKELVKYKEVILIGEWISKYSLLLAEHLQNIRVYKKKFFQLPKKNSTEYSDLGLESNKYLEYYKNFYTNRTTNKNIYKSNFAQYKRFLDDPFKNIRLYNGHERNYFETQDPSRSIASEVNKIIFVGDNEYFIKKYLKKVPMPNENYYWYDCSENKFIIKQNMDGLVFTSINKLSAVNLIELMSDISSSEYKNKPVFFLTVDPISTSPDDSFIQVAVPTTEECRKFYRHFFYDMIYEKHLIPKSKAEIFESLYTDLCNSGNLDNFFNTITSLSEIDTLFNNLCLDRGIKTNFLHLDFWYEFVNYYDSQLITGADANIQGLEIKQSSATSQKPTLLKKDIPIENIYINENDYVFKRLPNKHFLIIFNNRQIYPQKPNSDGLFYIYTIIKQASYEPIPVKTLYDLKLENIQKKSKKEILSSDDAETFSLTEKPESISQEEKNLILDRLNEEKKHIEENIEQAKLYAEKELIKEFNDELIKLEEEIIKIKYNKKRNLDKNRKKAIDKALKEAKDQFKKSRPEFYNFLDQNIIYNVYNYSYSYKNTDNIAWILE
jgi:hypothetical protein